MKDPGEDRVVWGTVEIPYKIIYSKRKTLGISVHPDMSVVVKAPIGTNLQTIRQLITKRGGWIQKSWRYFEPYLPKLPPRRYISGETHRYLGRQYRLKVVEGDQDTVKCLRGQLWVTTKKRPQSDKVKELLEGWYRAHAEVIFKERLLVCHKKMSKFGFPLPTLIIRRMVSRWGSFSSAGRVTLNLRLIATPVECIDYVILHELCHVRVKHHTPKFWHLMERLMPDFEERREKLNRFKD